MRQALGFLATEPCDQWQLSVIKCRLASFMGHTPDKMQPC